MSMYGHSSIGTPFAGTPYSTQKISLSDLTVNNENRNQNATAASPNYGNSNTSKSIDYKKELSKLLTKSRGTAYETTLKRFVETKLREIGKDIEVKKSKGSTPQKLDLFSLSTSKYDSPNRSAIRESIIKMQELNDSATKKNRLEDMSQPLERNKYKVNS